MPLTTSTLDALVADLRAVAGDRVSTAAAVREHHSHGESWHAAAPPDAVVFPTSTDEVSRVVAACAAHDAPIIPFGIGSSLEGHVNAVRGGVSIDLTRMTRVLRLSQDDMDVTVEAGLTHRKLNEALKNTGLVFMVDPGRRRDHRRHDRHPRLGHRGGALRHDARDRAGPHGGARRRTRHPHRRPRAQVVVGYDLTRLFVGSEGTLGVITEVTLRLYGRPEAISTAVCGFASMEGAATTVIETIQLGVPVARIEIIDEVQLAIVNRFSKTSFPEVPTLFFEFHGPSASLGGGTGAARARGGRWPRRHVVPVDRVARGAREAVGGAPQRALRDDRLTARLQGVDDRRVRADRRTWPTASWPRRPICASRAWSPRWWDTPATATSI